MREAQSVGRGSEESALSRMNPATTALLLVGFQNEFFAESGSLRNHIVDSGAADRTLATTVDLTRMVAPTDALVVAAPIVFNGDATELESPVGVLATIKERGAFREGTHGARMPDALAQAGAGIVELPARRGFNAFKDSPLDDMLRSRGIVDVVVAGALTCLCVDSTARGAHERGYRVTVLSDCTVDRTKSEQNLFCERIFPLYADVTTSDDFVARLVEA